MDECMYPGCSNEASTRGLCANHYGIAGRLVKDGNTTWDKLIEDGKALPKRTTRRGVKFTGKAQQHFLTDEQITEARQASES